VLVDTTFGTEIELKALFCSLLGSILCSMSGASWSFTRNSSTWSHSSMSLVYRRIGLGRNRFKNFKIKKIGVTLRRDAMSNVTRYHTIQLSLHLLGYMISGFIENLEEPLRIDCNIDFRIDLNSKGVNNLQSDRNSHVTFH
jgi:hypothetical protein